MTVKDICRGLWEKGVKVGLCKTKNDGESNKTIMVRITEKHGIALNVGKVLKAANDAEIALEDVVMQGMEAINSYICQKINDGEVFSQEYILEHLRIGLREEREEDGSLSKKCRDFEGLEKYICLYDADIAGSWSFSVFEKNFRNAGIAVDEAWERAEKNTFEKTCIIAMIDFQKVYSGGRCETYDPEERELFIVTNEEKWNGASAILDYEALKQFSNQNHLKKLLVFPSSIHEMLVMDGTDMEMEEATEIVRAVNATSVEEHEILTDRAYFLEF